MTAELDYGNSTPDPRKPVAQTWAVLEQLDASAWQTIVGESFVDGEVYLDGRRWIGCHFGNRCRIVTALGLFKFEQCTFDPGIHLVLDPPASAAVDLVAKFERGVFGGRPLTN